MREFSVHSLKNVVRAAGVRVMVSGADIHIYISYIYNRTRIWEI